MYILVANRGEIACRIIKSIKKMGHSAVAIYSTQDKNAMHVKMADFSVCIGSQEAKDSYLNMLNILIVSTSLEIDAIHPGYGFLSENAQFVDLCEELKVTFIGPTASNIRDMGNKISALRIMQDANSNGIKNSFVEILDEGDLNTAVKTLKLPLIIKYASGGGGKGMRIVKTLDELQTAYTLVLLEAKQVEENPQIFAEKFIENAKHIEIQIVSDKFGNFVPLGSRDCSTQRNSQKIIEEAPANIDNILLEKMIEVSLNIAKKINYVGVGTVEFLVKDNEFYFLEMNTRLQVEHTVTEQIYGIDLVEEQINIALGKPLSFTKDDLKVSGHSIECRINAEDPLNNFTPIPGIIKNLELDKNLYIRNDFGFEAGDTISPFYDSLIGKIIVTAPNRKEAIKKMQKALDSTKISPIKTTLDFNKVVLEDKIFLDNLHTTTYIKDEFNRLKDLVKKPEEENA